MTRTLCLLTVVWLYLPATAKAQETVTRAQVEVFVGPEDMARVGFVNLEVEYLGDTLFKQDRLFAGEGRAERQPAGTFECRVPDGTIINLAKPVKLYATLGDTRGPGKHNNTILRFEVRLTTNQGNLYVGSTPLYFFDTDNHGGIGEKGKLKGVWGGTPSKRFEIKLEKK
jgi:hypothetical protein